MMDKSFSCPQCRNQREYFVWGSRFEGIRENTSMSAEIMSLLVLVCPSCGFVDLTTLRVNDIEKVRSMTEKRRRKRG
jgi:predicted nucleic-acid-binding Zn-ribbon protein